MSAALIHWTWTPGERTTHGERVRDVDYCDGRTTLTLVSGDTLSEHPDGEYITRPHVIRSVVADPQPDLGDPIGRHYRTQARRREARP